MKKKFLIILLSLIFTFSLTGCGSPETATEPQQSSPAQTDSSEWIFATLPDSEGSSAEEASLENFSTDAAAAETAPQEISSLQDWLDSENKEQNVTDANAQLNPVGLSIDFYSEDSNILVLEYTFIAQQDMGKDMDEIHKTFEDSIAPIYSDSVASLFDSFKSEYGIALDDIKLVFCNADGTELYSVYCNK